MVFLPYGLARVYRLANPLPPGLPFTVWQTDRAATSRGCLPRGSASRRLSLRRLGQQLAEKSRVLAPWAFSFLRLSPCLRKGLRERPKEALPCSKFLLSPESFGQTICPNLLPAGNPAAGSAYHYPPPACGPLIKGPHLVGGASGTTPLNAAGVFFLLGVRRAHPITSFQLFTVGATHGYGYYICLPSRGRLNVALLALWDAAICPFKSQGEIFSFWGAGVLWKGGKVLRCCQFLLAL